MGVFCREGVEREELPLERERLELPELREREELPLELEPLERERLPLDREGELEPNDPPRDRPPLLFAKASVPTSNSVCSNDSDTETGTP